ncbi:hypothetical protein GCM10007416_23700 [Kroppenstedtia guangzhouensis]|uniref:HTH cro/C1-type domain-containing protein n=1 Tax=Kroppenstedtia guangzhouensis TaxID=1274356 RepID=A0ABQ1GSZ8_9BACL|nr:contact-dependent growth inhibition system immunity protein [Kroppenstedtia guangzhouensis]GGA49814.1 hypothetical protein GCM10007416_23700 [Kroppenstedtia guangzhouensis]
MDKKIDLSFKDIEKKLGITKKEVAVDENYSLSIWYEDVRSTQISRMSVFDLARCLRQNIYIEYILPEVLSRLWENPMLGHMTSGELMNLLSRIDKNFWRKNDRLRIQTERLVHAILHKEIVSPDYQLEDWIVEEFFSDVRKLKAKLQS